MDKTFYITTPIYYVNDRPHLGHASTTVWADVQARYRRLIGQKTFFLTGLDEHGMKVQQAAEKQGVSPQQHCDEMARHFQELWKNLLISNDDFVRTTQERHKILVQKFLTELHQRGAIYKKTYHGWYSKIAEQFVTEKEMVDGKFPAHLGDVIELEEENYFFKMSEHQPWLVKYIQDHPDWIQPENRRNEIMSWLQKPLDDLCISRPRSRLSWGIPVPFDSNYVTYVWVDALVNYISIVGYGSNRLAEFWPADWHLIAKDILTTHAVYWPTMLHALDIEMPRHILAHGFWLKDGQKMSKSLGNVVNPQEYVAKYGADAFRYFLCRELQLSNDSDFTDNRFLQRFNADLANDLGNLANRSLSMIQRYRKGVVPDWGEKTASDDEIVEVARVSLADYHKHMEAIAYHSALEAVWKLISRANRYVDENAPWKLAKDPASSARLDTVLRMLAETTALLSHLIAPFMPTIAGKLEEQLNMKTLPPTLVPTPNFLPASHVIGKPEPLFPRQQVEAR